MNRIKKHIVFASDFIKPKEGGLRNPNTRFIYHLSDPETLEICYVGQTSNPENRYGVYHRCSGSINGNSALSKWLKGLKDCSLSPVMTIMSQLNIMESMPDWEELLAVKRFWANGSPLLNTYCRISISKGKFIWIHRISAAQINKRVKVY